MWKKIKGICILWVLLLTLAFISASIFVITVNEKPFFVTSDPAEVRKFIRECEGTVKKTIKFKNKIYEMECK